MPNNLGDSRLVSIGLRPHMLDAARISRRDACAPRHELIYVGSRSALRKVLRDHAANLGARASRPLIKRLVMPNSKRQDARAHKELNT